MVISLKESLHILFLCSWYPSRVFPTNGDFIQRHAEAVAGRHKVTVLHIVSDDRANEKIEISRREIQGVITYIAYVQKTNNPLVKGIRFLRAFGRLIQQIQGIDVVHLNTFYPFGFFALYLKWKKRIPYIISEHWTRYLSDQGSKIGGWTLWWSRQMVKHAAVVSPVSNNLGSAMQRLGLKGHYSPVPNVVDTASFKPTTSTHKTFTLVHVSSLIDPHKNISGMLRVARQLEDRIGAFNWEFIGGNGTQYQALVQELDFQKANIQFIDHLSHEDLIQHLARAHAFVLFSNYENLPCVILEAFACGVPVVTTDVGGIREYFPADFGRLIPKGNTEALLKALMAVKETKGADASVMHQYAVDHFSPQQIAQQFSTLYERALSKQGRGV